MNFNSLVAKLDDELKDIKPTQDMTKAEFEAYALDQVAKAKKELEDEKKDPKAKGKAKKRLDHLGATLATLAKDFGDDSTWHGQSNTITIPVYEGGYTYGENLTVKTDQSDTTLNAIAIMQGSGAAGTTGFANGSALAKAAGSLDEALASLTGTKTAPAELDPKTGESTEKPAGFSWPSDLASKSFLAKGEVTDESPWGRDSKKSA